MSMLNQDTARRLVALLEVPDNWHHLKPHGYAPGNYLGRCLYCGRVVPRLDKRATACRSCAEERHAAWVAS